MMLTRFVRIQLALFTIAAIVGIAVMLIGYIQAPTLLGIGRITVTLQLPAAGGLYPFSNVTYRGIEVGTVTSVDVVDGRRVDATLSLGSSPRIPADLIARVRSVSAVGEQYVDLQPAVDEPPYLRDRSVITADRARIPEPVGPMLDRLNALVSTIPKERLGALLDESFRAFDGAGYDIGSLADSSATLVGGLDAVAQRNRALIDDAVPLIDSQAETTDALRTWARSFADLTDEVVRRDPQVRQLLRTGPEFAQQVTQLLEQVRPTLPILLANLTSIGQVLVTYNKSVEQLLVLFPPYLSGLQSVTPVNNPTGRPLGDFAVSIADPPSCTVGFLPPSEWRSPNDTTEMDTPDGLYCKLPQDSPIAVRGARNYPCIEFPGKRAATVQDCASDQPFRPLATRQHVLGPNPLDPNLIAQGIPPDSRVTPGARLYAPVEGTPPPPAVSNDAAPPAITAPPTAAPSSFAGAASDSDPSLAVARYNPATGAYMASNGRLYRQSDLATTPKSWTDLLPRQG